MDVTKGKWPKCKNCGKPSKGVFVDNNLCPSCDLEENSKLDSLKNDLENILEECKKCECWSEKLETCDGIVLCDKRERIIDLYRKIAKLN